MRWQAYQPGPAPTCLLDPLPRCPPSQVDPPREPHCAAAYAVPLTAFESQHPLVSPALCPFHLPCLHEMNGLTTQVMHVCCVCCTSNCTLDCCMCWPAMLLAFQALTTITQVTAHCCVLISNAASSPNADQHVSTPFRSPFWPPLHYSCSFDNTASIARAPVALHILHSHMVFML